jgi:EAL domain-containing protein (putative c-di-GMP-specific phosphodiesterase class I)
MLVTLAHSLGLDVIAEGVESQMQREKLIAAGCTVGQGFYFARPLDRLEEVERWINPTFLAETS